MSVQELEIAIEKLSPAEVESLAQWLQEFRAQSAPPEPSPFDILRDLAGSLDMPPDWAEQHDHYLTGAPKRPST